MKIEDVKIDVMRYPKDKIPIGEYEDLTKLVMTHMPTGISVLDVCSFSEIEMVKENIYARIKRQVRDMMPRRSDGQFLLTKDIWISFYAGEDIGEYRYYDGDSIIFFQHGYWYWDLGECEYIQQCSADVFGTFKLEGSLSEIRTITRDNLIKWLNQIDNLIDSTKDPE